VQPLEAKKAGMVTLVQPLTLSERLNQVEADSPSVEQKKVADASELFADPNRHVVEVPDSFAVARWSRDADVATTAAGRG
jgi:hypothetical protein